MKARVNTFLNVRTGTLEILPDNNPNDSFFRPGDIVEIAETVIGEEYKGNSVWHKLDTGIFISNFGVDLDKNLFLKENMHLSRDNNLSQRIILNNPVGKNGNGITIGIMDSGIDTGHPSLRASLRSEEIDCLTVATPKLFGHGTNIAGLLVGNDDDVAGVSIDAGIRSYRIIKNNQRVEDNALIKALQDVKDKNIELDIINLSLDIFEGSRDPVQNLIDALVAKGIIIIVAAGKPSERTFIAGLKNIIGVEAFSSDEFSLIKNQAPLPGCNITFLNRPIVTTGLNATHEPFQDASAFTAVTSGIVARFLSDKFVPKSIRLDKVKKYLLECSFSIKSENQPVFLKPYKYEST